MKFKDPMCKGQLSFYFVLLALLLTATQSGFAQSPLSFSNNFFVTGDYIVAGAYGMTTNFTTINGISYAVGTINVPDKSPGAKGVANPGIQGATSVPKGAQIVAALLYWQTVEKVGVAPGAPGSGQNGYFLPLANAGSFPKGFPGYAIQGTGLTSPGNQTVSWSSGGCSGGSTGKVLRTYRADVAGGLPVDKNGNSTANTSFQVLLPSVGNSTPITLGATLVVIYRILSGAGGPPVPLNSIVIYDGDYGQSTSMLTMTQPLHGFYDADANPVSRLTHIVGSGQSNKFQTVYLGSGANTPTSLPSLYPKLPAFPGWYVGWDNPTWTFTSASKSPSNPIIADASTATTEVVPSSMNQGCVSWGAVIMSTTVADPDGDGILKSWKNSGGYCDYLANPSCTGSTDPAWIALPDAHIGDKDIYLHYDYMCSKVTGANSCAASSIAPSLSAVGASSGATATYTGTFSPPVPAGALVTVSGFTNGVNNGQFFVVSGTSTHLVVNNANAVAETNPATATYGDYSFDPTLAIDPLDSKDAVQKVVDAFANHQGPEPFVLHVERGNAIQESATSCADTDTDANGNLTCIFPNEPGTVGFREGLAWIKNSTIETGTGMLGCDPSSDPNCVGFQHGKKDSYHYALFSHGVGLESWFLSDTSLQSVTQSGTTVTFTTKSPHGLMPIAGDTVCSKAKGYIGRVTVLYAITNPNLNYTFCAKPVGNPPAANKFAVTLRNTPLLPGTVLSSYTVGTDPNLSVADGNVTSMSGYSDLGGQNSVISLGEGGWAPVQNLSPPSEGNKWNVKAGTFMHEVGHTLGLTHGGTFYNNNPNNGNSPNTDFTPFYEVNCKANVQSVMSYMFQFDLLQAPGPGNEPPIKVLDFSKDPAPLSPEAVPTLAEGSAQSLGTLNTLSYPYTSWFQRSLGPLPSNHCDGSPTVTGENSYLYTNQPIGDFMSSAGQDINFNGSTTDVMHPHNEWEGTPAVLVSGVQVGPSPGVDLQQVSAAGTVSAIGPGGEAGGLKPSGTGGGLKPAGTGGGLKPAGTGGAGFTPAGGGGGFKPAGTGGASFDVTHNQASSYPRPPQNLYINQEEASPRLIDLNWFAASFGTAVQYNIYRAAAGVNGDAFSQIGSVPGSQTSFTDTVTCNTGGYQYRVTAVTNNDAGTQLESSPSNTVPASLEPLLTGCYTVSGFSVPGSAVQGTTGLQVTWTLTDDFFVNQGTPWADASAGNSVTRGAANTLVAIGPLPNTNCTTSGRTTLVTDGNPAQAGTVDNGSVDTFTGNNTNNFVFTWNRTDAFCAGSYTFELDLDHVGASPAQKQAGPNALQLGIDINDQDAPHITTLALPNDTVGFAYSDTLTEDGGTAPVKWTVTGLPSGISQQSQYSPTLSGTTCLAATINNVMATVTDSAVPTANSASQTFTLLVNKASTTTGVMSSANPSVFQQMVTFTVTVTPQYGCVPSGTVTLMDAGVPIASLPLPSGGIATFALPLTQYNPSVGVHSITASYGGDANFTSSTSGVWSQTVNRAQTLIAVNSVSPSTIFVGQPFTVFYTLSVVAPGAGSPIPPTGSITVTASDGSACVPQPATSGMCTLSPAPTTAGAKTFLITYSGDGNFLGAGSNSIPYTVYQLVFTTQPSTTGVGLTITPAVQVTAEDSSSNPLATFTGGITVAIGSGSGTLSGTATQTATSGVATFGDLSINKIANGYTLTAAPSGGVPDATSNTFNIDTFYVDGSGNFGTLDLPTGTVTKIGSATVPNSSGMDLTPGLLVYEYNTSTNQLVEIAPSTGAATPVGAAGSIPDQATTGALTDGSYFGIDAVTGNLYKIDLTSGQTTPIGGSNPDGVVLPAGCTLEASLTGSASALYYTIGYSGASCGSPMPDTLYQIDPTNGNTTSVGPVKISGTPANGFVGSAFVGSTLYGFTTGGQEYTINTTTGVATSVASTTPTTAIIGAGSSQ